MIVKQRPKTTLYMLTSLDGKISTGDNDILDFDKDLPKINGIKEGLKQYYEIEKTTDICSFNTGKVTAKIGLNTRKDVPAKMPVTFVIVDNKPHLTESGVRYLSEWTKKIIIVTTNKSHPAKSLNLDNLQIIRYPKNIVFKHLFEKLYSDFAVKRLTIQSGGEMNAELIRQNLIDNISLVIAPAIVGGRNTSTLIDGESLHKESDLKFVKALKLIKLTKLKNSYIHLRYKVLK